MNLGQSTNFGKVDTEHIPYPVTMSVDYIRVYQPKDGINYGCSPQDFPTADYINQYVPSLSLPQASNQFVIRYIEAYTNPNLTTWRDDFKQPFPKNKFLGQC